MSNRVVFNGANTPEEIAAAAESKVLGAPESRVATEFEGASASFLQDLDDPTIAGTVGPGAMAQSLGREAAREAAKEFPNTTEPITPAQASLLGTVGNLNAQESALRAAAADFASTGAATGTMGEYYGDLRTGQVVTGPQISEDRRIGPFHSPQLAQEALKEAIQQYRHPQ